MKKRILLGLAMTLLIDLHVFAQTYVVQVKPIGSESWGYANIKGEMIIPPKFQKCYEFSADGLAAIYDNVQRQYSFVNLKGEFLSVEFPNFKLKDGMGLDLSGFSDGRVPVKIGKMWGYFNVQGKLAIAAKYDDAWGFSEGRAIVESAGHFLIIDTEGRETPIDISGITDVKSFSENLAICKMTDLSVGFIGTDGKIAIPAEFQSVGSFHGGLAWAKKSDKMVGYINEKGEWAIPAKFTAGKDFDPQTGIARVKIVDQWAYVTRAGEIVYANDTDVFEDFFNGLARGRKNGQFGFYNAKGQWAIQPQFDGARDFKNGYAAVKQGGKWGVIDTEGKWIISPMFMAIKDVELVK